jgi:hypothetical protein
LNHNFRLKAKKKIAVLSEKDKAKKAEADPIARDEELKKKKRDEEKANLV